MATLNHLKRLLGENEGLAVFAVTREDGSVHASVVNAGIVTHPTTGTEVVGVVVAGSTAKLRFTHFAGRASVTVRSAWSWAGVEGPTHIVGPDNPYPGIDAERLRMLLREVFIAAGGTHEDFSEYDRVMAKERRTVVLVQPERVLGSS